MAMDDRSDEDGKIRGMGVSDSVFIVACDYCDRVMDLMRNGMNTHEVGGAELCSSCYHKIVCPNCEAEEELLELTGRN